MSELLNDLCVQYLTEEPDEFLRDEINELKTKNPHSLELNDRMGKFLTFGTAGLRSRMQAGYNRMNVVTVYRLAYALATQIPASPVVVAFDARNNSRLFAYEAAHVLSMMGLEVSLWSEPIPTPLCAFATKYLQARMGVMITASHNPAYDNGIKLYDQYGAQAHGQFLTTIEELIPQAPLRSEFYKNNIIKSFKIINEDVFAAYLAATRKTRFFEENILDKNIAIVYTALHGVGQKYFLRAAADEDFKNIYAVDDQAEPDGNFPTISFPNPEEEYTLDRAHAQARHQNISWVFANDPDADRLQVSYKNSVGELQKLSGNEMGSILGFFAIEHAHRCNSKPLVASSIVSSRMLKIIARDLQAYYVDALTGFSNIANAAQDIAKNSNYDFVFAYEEAIGFLVGDIILDKDGISTGARFLEIAAWLKYRNISLWDFLDELYLRFGLFINNQWALRYDGIAADIMMADVMSRVRMLSAEDFAEKINISTKNLLKYDLKIPSNNGAYAGLNANVIIFEDEENLRVIIRPSGTEPKIKIYCEIMSRVQKPCDLGTKKAELAETLHELRLVMNDILS